MQVDERLELLRSKILGGGASIEEIKEAVQIMRAGRLSAASKPSKSVAPTRPAGSLLASFKASLSGDSSAQS